MPSYYLSSIAKVIIHKSRGEVSLVEQDTIELVSITYLYLSFKQNIFGFLIFKLCNLLVQPLEYFFLNAH